MIELIFLPKIKIYVARLIFVTNGYQNLIDLTVKSILYKERVKTGLPRKNKIWVEKPQIKLSDR